MTAGAATRDILMPELSPGMEQGRLARWLVAAGDRVAEGDVIAEIETDKAVLEFEADAPGRIAELLVDEGAGQIRVNTPIARMGDAGTEAAATGAPPSDAPRPQPAQDTAQTRPAPREARDWPAEMETRRQTVREALHDALAEEMAREDSVVLIGEGVAAAEGPYKVSHGLLDRFGGERVVDMAVTEAGFSGLGVGAAFGGLRPVVEFVNFSFSLQAMDQIVNTAAKTLYMSGGAVPCPIVFRGPNGAGARVGAQHAQCFAAWFAHVPGLKVAMPYSASDAKGLLKTAIRDPNPVIFLENESLYGQSFDVPVDADRVVPFGQARIWREGGDVTLVSYGIGMKHALAAADALAGDGISATVIDLRTLRPIDLDTVIESVRRTHACVTVEEGWPMGGIGAHLASEITRAAFDDLDAPVTAVTGADVPMPYAESLEALARIDADAVIRAVRSVLYR